MPNPTLSSTLTAPPPNWVPFDVACRSRQLKNLGGGNKAFNRAYLLNLIKTEITTNGLASTWARKMTIANTRGYKVIIKNVPGAHAA